MDKSAVLLINIGTPDSPDTSSVRKYLFQFLNDKRVIDLPFLLRKFLVNLIIVPFRAPKSAKLYKQLWQPEGSPLLYNTDELVSKLNSHNTDKYDFYTAMRYGNPSLQNVLGSIKDKNYNSIILFPMFPQYASSTTGSLLEFAMNEMSKWYIIPEIRSINQYYSHPKFIEAFIHNITENHYIEYDHIIFSYHGLPLNQVNQSHIGIDEHQCTCTNSMPEYGKYCYKATCYETTRLLADKLKLKTDSYSMAFQSRLTNKWLKPFTDELVVQKAKQGVKKLMIVAPAFVTDCLETIVELEIEYGNLFRENGGKELKLVSSLNSSDIWADAIIELIRK